MKKEIWPICSFNFTLWNAARTDMQQVKEQIDVMVKDCAVNTVNFTIGAHQEHTYSTLIDWKGSHMPKDTDMTDLFRYAKEKGLKRIMKPMLNPTDGYWRGFIHFFNEDVPCEPKWSDWFKNYTEYMVHYAELCEKEEIEMLIIGCEMVGTDHRADEWRNLVAEVKKVYSGLVTYNCDKYQEHNVKWWDACDVISSSGYYPVQDWTNQISRIEAVVKHYDLPFFFSEVGCPSTTDSANIPNDWTLVGKKPVSQEEQEKFFETMFTYCEPLHWHYGYSIWDWPANVRPNYDAETDGGYSVFGKSAEKLIRKVFSSHAL